MFSNGDGNVSLSDAIELRVQILRLSDQMTVYGQKIRDLGKSGVEPDTDVTRDEEGPLPAGKYCLLSMNLFEKST